MMTTLLFNFGLYIHLNTEDSFLMSTYIMSTWDMHAFFHDSRALHLNRDFNVCKKWAGMEWGRGMMSSSQRSSTTEWLFEVMVQRAQEETKHFYVCACKEEEHARERAGVCPPACIGTCVKCLQMRGEPTRKGGLRSHFFRCSTDLPGWLWCHPLWRFAVPSLVFTGDKINAERESKAERRLVCSCFPACFFVFVHAQLWTYTYTCSRSTFCINAFTVNAVHVDKRAFLCHELVRLCCHAFVCSPGSWRCRHPGGLAGRIQSCRRWYSGLRCWSGGQGYCTLALHCGLMVPGSQWLRTNNVRNYQGLCVCVGKWWGLVKESRRNRVEKEKEKLTTTF